MRGTSPVTRSFIVSSICPQTFIGFCAGAYGPSGSHDARACRKRFQGSEDECALRDADAGDGYRHWRPVRGDAVLGAARASELRAAHRPSGKKDGQCLLAHAGDRPTARSLLLGSAARDAGGRHRCARCVSECVGGAGAATHGLHHRLLGAEGGGASEDPAQALGCSERGAAIRRRASFRTPGLRSLRNFRGRCWRSSSNCSGSGTMAGCAKKPWTISSDFLFGAESTETALRWKVVNGLSKVVRDLDDLKKRRERVENGGLPESTRCRPRARVIWRNWKNSNWNELRSRA